MIVWYYFNDVKSYADLIVSDVIPPSVGEMVMLSTRNENGTWAEKMYRVAKRSLDINRYSTSPDTSSFSKYIVVLAEMA